jgi:chemotaxis protein CheD
VTRLATPGAVQLVVGVADMKLADRFGDALITYALGSCLGIAAHDPVAGVGGLIHVMLPNSARHPERAREKPFMFVDTGVPRLFQELYRLGGKKERLVVTVAGGAAVKREEEDRFQIGRNNLLMLRKLFWKNGVLIAAQDVGGNKSRTMRLQVGSGVVSLKVGSIGRVLSPGEGV